MANTQHDTSSIGRHFYWYVSFAACTISLISLVSRCCWCLCVLSLLVITAAGAATNACLEIDEAPPPYPQGSELILWSEEDLRDFCAKYSLDHTGDRPALERRVRAEMRSKTDAKLEKLTGAPPAGVSTRPLFKFEFATDAKLAAKLGQAREPQRLEPATKSVLVALRRAVNQQRSLYGRGMRDLHECFVTMDEGESLAPCQIR
eukprot:COSAG05_NODE_95_length_19507_cov_71.031791_9_plen_204_part_00